MLQREEVFQQDWAPNQLLHRDREQETLLQVLGKRSNHVLLHGPSGVGKTVLVERVRERLAAEQGIETAYVESMDAPTATVLRSVLRDLSGSTPPANTPQEDLSLQLYERVNGPVAVFLDEADDLHETTALERLFDVEGLAVVTVVHDADEFLAAAADRTREQFHTGVMHVPKFGSEELAEYAIECRGWGWLGRDSR
ncbi:AAA family ATPase [Halovenus rubra]|uniref:AAA family ATPase n=2 Tax=Halovenus rubra TaxID=869890 RepID=A0ACC7E053_9EURY